LDTTRRADFGRPLCSDSGLKTPLARLGGHSLAVRVLSCVCSTGRPRAALKPGQCHHHHQNRRQQSPTGWPGALGTHTHTRPTLDADAEHKTDGAPVLYASGVQQVWAARYFIAPSQTPPRDTVRSGVGRRRNACCGAQKWADPYRVSYWLIKPAGEARAKIAYQFGCR
jgi:hypothetical protein